MKINIQNYLWVIFYEYQLELMINDQFYEYQLETVLHSWEWASSVGRITTEDNLLMVWLSSVPEIIEGSKQRFLYLVLDLFKSLDQQAKGVREILPEGWRLNSLELLRDTTRKKPSLRLMYLFNSSWALLSHIPSDRLTTSILLELEGFPWPYKWGWKCFTASIIAKSSLLVT